MHAKLHALGLDSWDELLLDACMDAMYGKVDGIRSAKRQGMHAWMVRGIGIGFGYWLWHVGFGTLALVLWSLTLALARVLALALARALA